MVDIPTEIVRESIRRRIEQARSEASSEIELLPEHLVQAIIDPEELRDLAALNIAMAKIIQSVSSN